MSPALASTEGNVEARSPGAAATSLAVVFLIREVEGIERARRFFAAYDAHPAGIEHDLVVLLKGFPDGVPEAYSTLLNEHGARAVTMEDAGFDIGSYRTIAARLPHEWLCFLNSHSEPLVDGWLQKLYAHAVKPGVGLVGATGSYECVYRQMIFSRDRARGSSAVAYAWYAAWALVLWFHRPFPNYTIRTNAFIVASKVFRSVRFEAIRTKRDAYRFENGGRSLTRQIRDMGLKALVVGADGCAYELQEWPWSNTFRIGQQTNLLVADNHTRAYATANEEYRVYLRSVTWGDRHAQPAAGSSAQATRW
jgi:hypothetical protein